MSDGHLNFADSATSPPAGDIMTTRSYRPSNGTEGMIFDDAWCSRCQRDAAWGEDESAEPCEILSRTFIFDRDDPEYPVEWIEDDMPYLRRTNPRCTAFLPCVALGRG